MTEPPTEEDVVLKEYKTLATSPQADLSRCGAVFRSVCVG
jgi:hypothetical protein